AESRLQKIIDDPAQAGMQKTARAMLAFVAIRLHPEQRNAELARQLAGPEPDRDFSQDLIDYLRGVGEATGDRHEITDWILSFEQSNDIARAHAIARWRQQKDLPWLVAALSMIDSKEPAAGELQSAAGQVPSGSPAYPTIT